MYMQCSYSSYKRRRRQQEREKKNSTGKREKDINGEG